MAAGDDEEFASGGEFRASVTAIGAKFREGGKNVKLRDGRGGLAQARRFCGNAGAQVDEKLALDFEDAFVGGKDFAFVFFQLRRSEALGIDQSLLALVIVGREMQVGLGNFNVVAENMVEADFKRSDVGALTLALFHGGDDLFAVLAKIAQLVEFGVKAGANDAGLGGQRRRFV